MPRCIQCNAELGGTGDNFRVASISGGVLGDEVTEAYLWCETCGVNTQEVVYELFLGDEEAATDRNACRCAQLRGCRA